MSKNSTDFTIPYPQGITRNILRLPILFYQYGMGMLFMFTPWMILTTRGRKSGLPRHAVLEYRRHGSKYYVISGWQDRPNWVQNLSNDPIVTIQDGRQTRHGKAHIVADSSEAWRAIYKFRYNAPLMEWILLKVSHANEFSSHRLADIADEFTIIRIDLIDSHHDLPGVTVHNRWGLPIAFLLIALFALRLLIRPQKKNKSINPERN